MRMSVQWGDAAVEGTEVQWRAIGAWVSKLEADRPEPSPEITAQTEKKLIAGAPDFYTKLSRITEDIQKNIRYFIVDIAGSAACRRITPEISSVIVTATAKTRPPC